MNSKTRVTLLERLRGGSDAVAWDEFFDRYWRLIHASARRRGCSEHTAEEIVQDVMLAVFEKRDLFRYDPAQGRFRDWLAGVVRNKVAQRRRRPDDRIRGQGGDSTGELLEREADDASGGAISCDPSYRPATLDDRLDSAPLGPDECLRHARQLVAGLAGLHEAGMVHRDVKPSNCLFVDGALKLADFGLLTEADRQASHVGTRGYMPPDGRMDMRADVYASGLVIYEMLSGLPAERFPCLGEAAHEFAKNPALSMLNRLVLRACQPDPNERYGDARAMLAELEGPEQPTVDEKRRFSFVVAVSVACLVVSLAAVTCAWWLTRPPRVSVNFITEPFEATVHLDGAPLSKPDGTACRTPCTILNLPARRHHVVFKHDRLGELDVGEVDFTETREIVAGWRLGSEKPVADE